MRLYRDGENQENIKVGDIIEIYNGVFIKVKDIEDVSEEVLIDIKKSTSKIKGEIIAYGRRKFETNKAL